jgi:hypothetical protein
MSALTAPTSGRVARRARGRRPSAGAALAALTFGLLGAPAAAAPPPPPAAATAEATAPAPPAAPSTAAARPPAKPAPARGDGRLTAHQAQLTVKVARPEQARRAILAKLKELGGHALLITDTRLQLKVPPARLDALLDHIAAGGLVLDKARGRVDRTEEIKRALARLEGRRELLTRLRAFLAEADVEATLRIEQQMLGLIVETERLAGQLRLAEDAVAFARVDVSFTWRQSAPMRYVRSPFPWLNDVGLEALLSRFGSK